MQSNYAPFVVLLQMGIQRICLMVLSPFAVSVYGKKNAGIKNLFNAVLNDKGVFYTLWNTVN